MSEEQLKAFLEAVKADVALQEKLNAAADADAFVAIAKEVGFMIFADELLKLQWARLKWGQKRSGDELTDEELEGVAGGLEGKLGWCPSIFIYSC